MKTLNIFNAGTAPAIDRLIVIAHRGAAGSAPENTLASVALAVEQGADIVEIDVQETADGRIIVIHDSDFMRVGGVALNVWDGTFDEVRIVYSSFVSTMTQRPVDLPLLPIAPEDPEGEEAEAAAQDYIWEPSQAEMFAILLPLYLRNRVFMTLSEAFTSEHAARMTSMSAATQNAGEMIDALTLQRNRERQSAITAELLDIVGGANAL